MLVSGTAGAGTTTTLMRLALRMVADHLRNHTPLHSATIDAVLITRDNVEAAENASHTN